MYNYRISPIPDITQINVIVLDIDGTILKSNNRIQSGLDQVCRILNTNGIQLVLASARPINSILKIAHRLNIFGPAIGLNGSIIADNKKIFYQSSFQTEEILKILSKFQGISLNYYMDYDWFVAAKDKHIRLEEKLVSMKATVKNTPIPTAQKILVIGDRPILEIIQSELLQHNLVECNFSKSNYFEINPKGVNKVLGINQYLKIINLRSPLVMTIGDGENDLPMLKKFQIGIAMGNAPEIVKESACYVLDSNDDNGLVTFLNSFCKARGFSK